jgi:hypothetical protein
LCFMCERQGKSHCHQVFGKLQRTLAQAATMSQNHFVLLSGVASAVCVKNGNKISLTLAPENLFSLLISLQVLFRQLVVVFNSSSLLTYGRIGRRIAWLVVVYMLTIPKSVVNKNARQLPLNESLSNSEWRHQHVMSTVL